MRGHRRSQLTPKEQDWARELQGFLAPEEQRMTNPQRVSDIIPSDLWPEAKTVKLEEIAGIDVWLLGAEKRTVASKFAETGQHEAYFVLCQLEGGEVVKLLVSQQVLMNKLDKLVEMDAFPIIGMFSKENRYWDLT